MSFEAIYLVVGLILVMVALVRPFLGQRPVTAAMLYLAIGWLMSPKGVGYLALDAVEQAALLERVSELAVVTSLFVCGLKLKTSWRDPVWRLAARLAFLSMTVTIALVTLAGHYLLGLPLGVAVILGAVLAPTDPVLASDVQVDDIHDRDEVRFSLTGEAGLNDGAAFPFLYLGLGLLGHHHLGSWGASWWGVDVLWGVLGGLALGGLFGAGAGFLARSLDGQSDVEGVHEFLAFGLVFSSYGAAVAMGTHGFLAAFTAGIALRWNEQTEAAPDPDAVDGGDVMVHGVLGFKERIERLLEALTVILVGALVAVLPWDIHLLWFVPVLFLVFRPVAVLVGLAGVPMRRHRLAYLSWFGIRGIGSVYYLSYATENGLSHQYAHQLAGLVYPLLACSILAHGLSVSPLMARYSRTTEAESERNEA